MTDTEFIENRTFDEIQLGDQASLSRTLSAADIELFALVSGEESPSDIEADRVDSESPRRVVARGLWGSGLISAVLGTELPGAGTTYLGQSLRFVRPVDVGDVITATVTVAEKRIEGCVLVLDCRCVNQSGEVVITGQAEVGAPCEKVRRPRMASPDVRVAAHDGYRRLIERTQGGDALATAVAHPCSAAALAAAVDAAEARLIDPRRSGSDADFFLQALHAFTQQKQQYG